jgi:hypothetical protein
MNIMQHFSQGVLKSEPLAAANECPYPEEEAIPADLTPYPATILFP